MRLINHIYDIKYELVNEFLFEAKNDLVSFEGYEVLESEVEKCKLTLIENQDSRQAIATLNRPDNMSCLINIQFLVYDGDLHVSVNYRSQHSKLGQPHDENLINYLITKFLEYGKQHFIFPAIFVRVNVADYHYPQQ